MRIFLHLLAAFWAFLPSAFSQTPMPPNSDTPPIPAEIQRAINLLSGAGWADAQNLAAERKTVAAALPEMLMTDVRMANLITSKASSSDLMVQSIYQGLINASDHGIDCKEVLPKFFEKVVRSNDPEDLPDRSRFWVMRDTMLRNLAIRIVRSVEQRELTSDEITEIASDPSGWVKRVYPTKNGGATSQPSPVSNDATKTPYKRPADEQVVQPPAPKRTPEANPEPTPTTLTEESSASTRWPLVVGVIVLGLGLLWAVLKMQK